MLPEHSGKPASQRKGNNINVSSIASQNSSSKRVTLKLVQELFENRTQPQDSGLLHGMFQNLGDGGICAISLSFSKETLLKNGGEDESLWFETATKINTPFGHKDLRLLLQRTNTGVGKLHFYVSLLILCSMCF